MDAFLASLPAGTVEKQFEYWKLEPWGDEWERTSIGAMEIINAIRALAAGFGGGEPPAPLPADSLVPFRHQHDPDKELRASLKQLSDLEGI